MSQVVALRKSAAPIPQPGADLVPDGWCADVVMPWADEQFEQASIAQAAAQLAGLEAAYATLGADTLELTKARRYLEVRWGELLGDVKPGQRTDREPLQASNGSLDKFDRHRFRQMAKAKQHVIDLVRTATDADELSRARVLKGAKQNGAAHKAEQPATTLQGTYGAIVIDPPWRYGNAATRGAAEDHYPTMTIDELTLLPELCLPLKQSENSHLYLWTTAGMLRDAFVLLDAWGYTYKTNLVWVKPQIGMGNYFRVSHEHILFAVRGSAGRTAAKDIRSWFEAPRERHSKKPDVFYDLVEKASPGPYLDVFARPKQERLEGHSWDVWGNEV